MTAAKMPSGVFSRGRQTCESLRGELDDLEEAHSCLLQAVESLLAAAVTAEERLNPIENALAGVVASGTRLWVALGSLSRTTLFERLAVSVESVQELAGDRLREARQGVSGLRQLVRSLSVLSDGIEDPFDTALVVFEPTRRTSVWVESACIRSIAQEEALTEAFPAEVDRLRAVLGTVEGLALKVTTSDLETLVEEAERLRKLVLAEIEGLELTLEGLRETKGVLEQLLAEVEQIGPIARATVTEVEGVRQTLSEAEALTAASATVEQAAEAGRAQLDAHELASAEFLERTQALLQDAQGWVEGLPWLSEPLGRLSLLLGRCVAFLDRRAMAQLTQIAELFVVLLRAEARGLEILVRVMRARWWFGHLFPRRADELQGSVAELAHASVPERGSQAAALQVLVAQMKQQHSDCAGAAEPRAQRLGGLLSQIESALRALVGADADRWSLLAARIQALALRLEGANPLASRLAEAELAGIESVIDDARDQQEEIAEALGQVADLGRPLLLISPDHLSPGPLPERVAKTPVSFEPSLSAPLEALGQSLAGLQVAHASLEAALAEARQEG